MNTTMLIKTNKELKRQAQETARELGLPLGTIVNALMKQFVREKSIQISAAHTMTPYLERIIKTARADYKAGKNISPVFTNAKDALRWLNS